MKIHNILINIKRNGMKLHDELKIVLLKRICFDKWDNVGKA